MSEANETRKPPWVVDLQESAKAFWEIVWPKIKGWFGDAELIPVEEGEGMMAAKLDMFSGIDYWIVKTSEGIRGLASRVQKDTDYSTFTIRKDRQSGVRTEYAKLKEAIEEDRLYPYWTCQSYVIIESKTFLNSARCRTKDLITFVEQGKMGTKKAVERGKADYYLKYVPEKGAAWFFVVPWMRFRSKYEVDIYDEKGLPQMLTSFMREVKKEVLPKISDEDLHETLKKHTDIKTRKIDSLSIFDVNSHIYSHRELEAMSSSELQRVFIWITFDKCFREKVKDEYPEYNFSPIKYSNEFMAMEDRILDRDQFIDLYLKNIYKFKDWRISKTNELKKARSLQVFKVGRIN